MAMLNGSRMVALFLSVLFSLNVSFAQDDAWVTVAVYMEDPIVERVSQGVEDYLVKWNDPLTWETFERDFTPAREAQVEQVARDNRRRIQAAERFLKDDLWERGDGTSSWYPAWLPLALAETTPDSLFKNILGLKGPQYDAGARAGQQQTLREFFEADGYEPDGLDSNGSQKYRACTDTRPRCRKELFAIFSDLVETYDNSQASGTAPRIISFTVRAKITDTPPPPEEERKSFRGEQDGQGPITIIDPDSPQPGLIAQFDYASIRLLQPAEHDPDEYVIDLSPYWKPAAKPTVPAEASSWGRIKATFADD